MDGELTEDSAETTDSASETEIFKFIFPAASAPFAIEPSPVDQPSVVSTEAEPLVSRKRSLSPDSNDNYDSSSPQAEKRPRKTFSDGDFAPEILTQPFYPANLNETSNIEGAVDAVLEDLVVACETVDASTDDIPNQSMDIPRNSPPANLADLVPETSYHTSDNSHITPENEENDSQSDTDSEQSETDSEASTSPLTIEAKEERLLEKYHKVLKLLQLIAPKNRILEKTIQKFRNLLQDVMELDSPDTTVINHRMTALKFAILKNLSALSQRQGDAEQALAFLTTAAKFDYSDVVMMHCMGELAIQLDNFPLAANFFQDALTIRPTHWPSLDAMMTLMCAMNHFQTCLHYCLVALKNEPTYPRALVISRHIFDDHDELRDEWRDSFRRVSKFIVRPLGNSETGKRYLQEVELVKKRWCRPVEAASRTVEEVRLPILTDLTFESLANRCTRHLNIAVKIGSLMNKSVKICQPDSTTQKFLAGLDSSMVVDEESVENSMLSINDSSSQPDLLNNSGTKLSQKSSKSRKMDPSILEFAEKRRSQRNKTGPRNDEATIREMLHKFMSKIFGAQISDLWKTSAKSPDAAQKEREKAPKLFAENSEAFVVQAFLANNLSQKTAKLIRGFLLVLAEKWHHEWPAIFSRIYSGLYQLIAHLEIIPQYLTYQASMRDATKSVINLTLMAYEIVVDGWMKENHVRELPQNWLKQLNNLATWPYTGEFDDDKFQNLRILLLMAKWHELRGETGEMQAYLTDILARVNENDCIILPNLTMKNCLSKELVTAWIEGKKTGGQLEQLEAAVGTEKTLEIARGILATNLEKKTSLWIFFQPTHIRQILSAAEPNASHFVVLTEALMANLLTQWTQLNEMDNLDSAMKIGVRCSLLEMCDATIKYFGEVEFPADLSAEFLQKWATLVLELCVLSVHTVEGAVRKPTSLSSWILFYRILQLGDKLLNNSKTDEMVHFLEEVHNYLGEQQNAGWCSISNGAFLHLAVDRLMAEMNARNSETAENNSEIPVEDIEFDIEQCFSCLYGFAKSSSYITNHACRQVELSLARAAILYSFNLPEKLPEFDGYSSDCISQEFVAIITKIRPLIATVPYSISRDELNAYIKNFNPITEWPDIPNPTAEIPPTESKSPEELICGSCFYLLADYHYKNGEHPQAMLLYLSDLCVNPRRFDSWAGLALTRGAQLDLKLRSFDLKPDQRVFDDGKEAIQCFAIALKLRPTCEQLSIECGSLIYGLHSYISRQIAQSVQFRIKKDEKARLKLDRDCLLNLAQKIFLKAEECDERHESWLTQYLLGKTYEKLDKDQPARYLGQYVFAAECLYHDGAKYPQRIAYYKTPNLAVEALEMTYRVYASALKFLCRGFRGSEVEQREQLKAVEFYLEKTEKGRFAGMDEFDEEEDESPPEKDGKQFVAARVLESKILDKLEYLGADFEEVTDLKVWKQNLIGRSLEGLRMCLRRYPEHYKSMYRLARYYCDTSTDENHLQTTKDLLWGSAQKWEDVAHMPCPGLFAGQTANMLFKGVWHIKCEEIQRQLSFASHMFRAVSLAINVLFELRENMTLIRIFQQLLKPPASTAKRFLRVDDYPFLANLALNKALLSVMNRVDDYDTDTCQEDVRINFLREVLKMWTTAKKEEPLSRKNRLLCNTMLAHAYLRLVEGRHKDRCPVGDQDIEPDIITKAMKYIQTAKPKPAISSAITINLSTGKQEESTNNNAPSSGEKSYEIPVPCIMSVLNEALPSTSTYKMTDVVGVEGDGLLLEEAMTFTEEDFDLGNLDASRMNLNFDLGEILSPAPPSANLAPGDEEI